MTTLTKTDVETTKITIDEDLTKLVYERIDRPDTSKRNSPEYIWALLRIGIYAVIMLGLAIANPGYGLGLGRWWGRTKIARRLPILE